MSYKFLIIGGLHGNEPLGIQIVKKIQALNLPNIQAVYGNLEAIRQNVRFVESDLNRVFPGKINGNLEERRAFELTQICANYDFVLDFHNTHSANNDCGFVGGNNYQNTLKLASFLGLNKVIAADYDCVNKFVQGCLSVEISLSSKQNNVDFWLKKILNLTNFDPNQKVNLPQLFSFSRRVSREEQNQFQFEKWQAFEPISEKDKKVLNLPLNTHFYPIFVDDEYTKSYNFAGLIKKLQRVKNII